MAPPATKTPTTERALSGIRVLDFSSTIAGPHCTRLLADLGADVVKVEPPEGDLMRARPPLRNGASTQFGQLNAGKKSIVLDLKAPQAAAAARRLAQQADVVLENFRPGVMARLGLDYASLSAENPRLVYCAISGYGQTGPAAHLPAYAPVMHAASGFDRAHLAYQESRVRPDNCGIFIADVLSGTYAFGAILAALQQRERTGCGQMVDVSMLESMLSLLLSEVQGAQFEMKLPSRALFGPVATADGFIIVAIASERTFQALAAAAGRSDWIADKRFQSYVDRRVNWGALMDEFEEWTRLHSTEACLEALAAAGVPSSTYRTVAEAMADPQLAHRRALAEIADAGGTFKVMNPPFRLSQSDVASGPGVAKLGEHTGAELARAGLSPAEIAAITERSGR